MVAARSRIPRWTTSDVVSTQRAYRRTASRGLGARRGGARWGTRCSPTTRRWARRSSSTAATAWRSTRSRSTSAAWRRTPRRRSTGSSASTATTRPRSSRSSRTHLATAVVSIDSPTVPRLHPQRPDQGVAALRHGRLVLLAQRHELHGVRGRRRRREPAARVPRRARGHARRASGGTFVSGGSLGNLSALAVARDDGRRNHPGADPRHLRCAISEEAHSSVGAALHLLGMDPLVVASRDHVLTADALRAALDADDAPRVRRRRRGDRRARPTPASSTSSRGSARSRGTAACGTTSTPPTGARRCSGRTRRELFAGLRHADSFIVDPHKWLFAPLDCCALIYRDPRLARIDAHPARELPRRPARRRTTRARSSGTRRTTRCTSRGARAGCRCGSRSRCTAPTSTPTRSTRRSTNAEAAAELIRSTGPRRAVPGADALGRALPAPRLGAEDYHALVATAAGRPGRARARRPSGRARPSRASRSCIPTPRWRWSTTILASMR